MSFCKHKHLMLLPEKQERLRCRHCHLTIKKEDLEQNYCPECFEVSGVKRDDFEPVEDKHAAASRYRCEDCGIAIFNKEDGSDK